MITVKQWHRVRAPDLLRAQYPGTRAWQRDVADSHLYLPSGHLSVLVGQEPVDGVGLLWHLSISHRTNEPPFPPGRYPTWDEISEARYAFVPDEVTVAMLLPPRAEYLNVHPTTFHLWQINLEV